MHSLSEENYLKSIFNLSQTGNKITPTAIAEALGNNPASVVDMLKKLVEKKLVQYDYDFYDSDLKKYITKDWQKAHRVIAQFLSKNKHTTGDAYLLWRLKMIVADNDKYDVQGEVKHMKDFEIKTKTAVSETVSE